MTQPQGLISARQSYKGFNMLIKTNNINSKGTLYYGVVEVTSKSGGLWDVKVFFKRAKSDEEALKWYNKLAADVAAGKWNIWNTDSVPGVDILLKHYSVVYLPTAGNDTVELGYLKSRAIDENEIYNNYKGEGEVYEPDLVILGGWVGSLKFDDGNVTEYRWNGGTRREPEEQFIRIKKGKGQLHWLSTHPSPGTTSEIDYYLLNLPDGWEILEDKFLKD